MSNDVAVQDERVKTLATYLGNRKEQLTTVISHTLTADRLIKIAVAACARNPRLLDCSPEGVYSCVHTSAQLGLEVGGPLKHAHLVPFKNSKTGKTDCVLMLGYEGLIELIMRTGKIETVYAEAVRKGDDFSYELGLHRDLKHKRQAGFLPDGTNVVAAYAVVHFKGGGFQFVVMMRDEIDAIRSRAQQKDGPTWSNHFEEMAKKTAIRRLSKYVPKSIELADALALDDDDLKPVEGVIIPDGESKATKAIDAGSISKGSESQAGETAEKKTRKKKDDAPPPAEEKQPEKTEPAKAAEPTTPKEEKKSAPKAEEPPPEEPGSNDGEVEEELETLDEHEEKTKAESPAEQKSTVKIEKIMKTEGMFEGKPATEFRLIMEGAEPDNERSYFTYDPKVLDVVKKSPIKEGDKIIKKKALHVTWKLVDKRRFVTGIELGS